jgi:hypothetical protein
MLKYILKKHESDLFENRVQARILAKKLINPSVLQNAGISCLAKQMSPSQERLDRFLCCLFLTM